MAVINTNYLALVSQNNLNKSQSSLGQAIERLSSGLRINSAKDDAAGQAIANRFTANIQGLTQAARNSNDGISIAQTTEGALTEINNNLQRIRQLSVQAANGTNSDSDLKSIQDEIQQRRDEIDRVSAQTQFNGVKVLASDQALTIQVGANDSETISIDLGRITSETLGIDKLDTATQVTSLKDDGTSAFTTVTTLKSGTGPTWTAFNPTFSGAAGYDDLVVGNDNKLYAEATISNGAGGTTKAYYAATFDADTQTISVDTTTTIAAANINSQATEFDTSKGVVALGDVSLGMIPSTDPSIANVYMVNNAAGAPTAFYVESAGGTYYDASLDVTTGDLAIDLTTGSTNAPAPAGAAVTVQEALTALGTAAITPDLSGLSFGGTNALEQHENGNYYVKNVDNGETTYYAAEVSVGGTVTAGAEAVVDPLDALDKALAQVDSLRSGLGAIQNRFESTIANLNNTVNNLSAARSRIEDADYAVEVSNMTRAQILQQAGTAVLAQANQVPQTMLSLLG